MEPTMTRTIVVLPTYNEAENLPLIVPEILDQSPALEVLIVDDGSPDGTGKLADQLAEQFLLPTPRVHVLHRPLKQGLGAAYRAGLAAALDIGADQVIQMDADFSHPPDKLPVLLHEIETHDVVLGSRYVNGITVVNWPIERILLSWFGNLYARRATGLPISDMTGGFRCVRRQVLEKMGFERIRADGYAFQIEMNFRFAHIGARIKEIPFFFLDRERGESKLTWQIGFEALWIVWWLRLAHRLGRL
ncbi:MAG: polyprenol monophosphomannose synthase [bacterium]|nr:dolichyl-phosphate beta-D-mannosyltransferase [Deltaproteobacteria bacterium]MCP4905278.1 polyprenol monophosphomannose synthase [bacterium]